MISKFLFTILVSICLPCLVSAQSNPNLNTDDDVRARMNQIEDKDRFHKVIDDAADAYKSIVKGPHGEVPPSVLKSARCLGVLPGVVTGALIVGGSRGSGLASCKQANGAWSQPAPITLSQGSIGLQGGAKTADLVLFFVSSAAEKALKRGEISIGSDISAVAGSYDSKVSTPSAGIVTYSRSQGLFAGTSMNETKITTDKDYLASYYGKNVDYTALLEGRESPDSSGYALKLTQLFP